MIGSLTAMWRWKFQGLILARLLRRRQGDEGGDRASARREVVGFFKFLLLNIVDNRVCFSRSIQAGERSNWQLIIKFK